MRRGYHAEKILSFSRVKFQCYLFKSPLFQDTQKINKKLNINRKKMQNEIKMLNESDTKPLIFDTKTLEEEKKVSQPFGL